MNSHRVRIIVAFLAVYVLWGSTYLAIRVAIQTLPALLMAGARFIVAGAVLYAVARMNGAARPTKTSWRNAVIVGALLMLGGNGGVVSAEKTVSSGAAALLVATMPMWIVLLSWRFHGQRPNAVVVMGIVLGFLGIGILFGNDVDAVPPAGGLMLVCASLSWACGSLYARRSTGGGSLMDTALQMLAGGTLLLLAGLLSGEHVHPEQFSSASVLAFLYLIVCGSLIGYTAFVWLLGNVSPQAVSTYAYVNPIVAVLLGWALHGEPLTLRTLAATSVILGALGMIALGVRLGARGLRLPLWRPLAMVRADRQ